MGGGDKVKKDKYNNLDTAKISALEFCSIIKDI